MLCAHCHEPILPSEKSPVPVNMTMHQECSLRLVIGSVGHQKGECACYGKTDFSEDGMTTREAARAACEYFKNHKWPAL